MPVVFGTRERALREPGKLNPSSTRLEGTRPLQTLTLLAPRVLLRLRAARRGLSGGAAWGPRPSPSFLSVLPGCCPPRGRRGRGRTGPCRRRGGMEGGREGERRREGLRPAAHTAPRPAQRQRRPGGGAAVRSGRSDGEGARGQVGSGGPALPQVRCGAERCGRYAGRGASSRASGARCYGCAQGADSTACAVVVG